MRTGNSVWIPIGFTALYLASAIVVGAAIDLLQVDGNRGNGPALTEQFGLKHNQVTR